MTMKLGIRTLASTIALAAALGGIRGAADQTTPVPQQPGAPGGGMTEGLRIRGHWVIDVKTSGGVLVSHHEFDNSLTDIGSGVLARMLGRTETTGPWAIILSPGACGVAQHGCLIQENVTPHLSSHFADDQVFRTLSAPTLVNPSFATEGVVLSGNATFSGAGSISNVQTYIATCTGDVSPMDCRSNGFTATSTFTSHDLNSVSVAANQIVQVSVTFSFQYHR